MPTSSPRPEPAPAGSPDAASDSSAAVGSDAGPAGAAAARAGRPAERAPAAAGAAAGRAGRLPERARAPAGASSRTSRPTEHAAVPAGGRRWVLGVVLGLMLIVLVNLVFIYIAVSDADQIVPSYQLEHR